MPSAQAVNEIESANVLSCDASSIASLMSSIELVEELMRRAQKELDLPEPPKPCDYFSLMVGAGFAGLMVILLGRLAMSVEQVKQHCANVMNEAFSERKLMGDEAFKRTKLRSAVEKMLTSCGVDINLHMLDPHATSQEGCKVMVCISPEGGMRAGMPICLRTYPVDASTLPNCTIVEAICATFAIPGLFKSVDIVDSEGIRSAYVGIESFNPTVQLLDEAVNVLPNKYMACVISLGAMQNGPSATECERVAREMSARFMHRPGVYFRLCVSQGMGTIRGTDWNKRSGGTAHARAYLQLVENDAMMTEIAQVLTKGGWVVPMEHLQGAIPGISNLSHTIKQCPAPSSLFVGRQEIINAVERCLEGGPEERRVCVLYGLGGVGKTQLALKVAEKHKNDYQHIFYIDCTSKSTIETDLKTIALAKKVGEFADDALSWLARLRQSWLIIYNNADDTSINLRGYFPSCSYGSILVTTRNHGMINLAHSVGAAHHVVQMTDDEAQELFAKASGAIEDIGSAGADLVNVIGCFPLAIVQAGAYIRTNMCTTEEYLEMYRSSRGQILEDYANEVQKADDYELTVYATWRVSYQKLIPQSRQLFDVLAFLYYDHITEDIFRIAALGVRSRQSPLSPTDEETRIEHKITELLANFIRPGDGTWDKAAFLRTTSNLTSYSFLTYNSANRSYSMHPLVQQWTRAVVTNPDMACSCAALLLALSITDGDAIGDYLYRRTLLSHVDALPEDKRLRPRLAWRFQVVYRENARPKDDERLAKAVHEAHAEVFGRHSQYGLASMGNLARTYSSQGRWAEAKALQQEVVEIAKQDQGSKHPFTLAAMHNLARTYLSQGRLAEAEALQQEVFKFGKGMWSNKNPAILQAATNLAMIYSQQGRWREAEELHREVLEIEKQVWGSDHPRTLQSIGHLAMSRANQGQWVEAEILQQEVVKTLKRVWGNGHPLTLQALSSLVTTYLGQDQWAKAEVLQREILAIEKQTGGSEHSDTLQSMSNLAISLSSQGRWAEAEGLQQEVVEVGKQIWGSEHPRTIKAIVNLATIFLQQERWAEAEELQREVFEVGKRVWGSEHPSTLTIMVNLAKVCSHQGRWAEAGKLQREVLEVGRQVWGSEHPQTLLVMGHLSATYSSLSRWAEAEVLLRRVFQVGKRVWGSEHPHTLLAMGNLAQACSVLGQREEAEALQQEIIEAKKRVWGSSHKRTMGHSDHKTNRNTQEFKAGQNPKRKRKPKGNRKPEGNPDLRALRSFLLFSLFCLLVGYLMSLFFKLLIL